MGVEGGEMILDFGIGGGRWFVNALDGAVVIFEFPEKFGPVDVSFSSLPLSIKFGNNSQDFIRFVIHSKTLNFLSIDVFDS